MSMNLKQGMSKRYRDNPLQPMANNIYIGVVRNNVDPQRMGRLQVWLPDIGDDTPDNWITVSYASPFAGATPIANNSKDGQTEAQTQRSYGLWAPPPDIDNRVLVAFINGDIGYGYYFASLWHQNMNHMVPSMPMSKSTDDALNEKFAPFGPPTAEYNRKDTEVDPKDPKRPPADVLSQSLIKQGLNQDFRRGISGSSARRESPSKVMGILSPGGNALYIDDDADNEHIRIRTKTGAQIIVHEQSGFIYMNSKDGASWFEISDQGIDFYSDMPISIRSKDDINLHSDKAVNIDGKKVNIRGVNGVGIQSDKEIDLKGKKIRGEASDKVSFKAGKNLALNAGKDVGVSSGANISLTCPLKSVRKAAKILDNSGGPNGPKTDDAKVKDKQNVPQSDRPTVATRTPAHEPYDHPSSGGDHNHPFEEPATSGGSQGSGGSGGSTTPAPLGKGGDGIGIPKPTDGNYVKGSAGEWIKLPEFKDVSKLISFKGLNFSDLVHQSVSAAAGLVNIPYETLMGAAQAVSGLNANSIIRAAGSAMMGQTDAGNLYGLYQLSAAQWNDLYGKYGPQGTVERNVVKNDPRDTYSNAVMGAYQLKENASALAKNGYQHTMTDAVVAKILGKQGAATYQRALLATPNVPSVQVLKTIFGDERGQRIHDNNPHFKNRSVCESYQRIKSRVFGNHNIFKTYREQRHAEEDAE